MAERKVTDEQLIEARKTMSWTKAAEHFGVNVRTLQRQAEKMALRGHLPEMHIETKLPSFLKIKGTSQLMRRGEEDPLLSWVKTNTDSEALEALIRASCDAAVKELPQVEPRPFAGHYRSVGACPELRFEPLNIHRQCVKCNRNLSGNAVEYRIRLVQRIGAETVAWLEGPHEPRKYTVDEIKTIKAEYRAKTRELKKGEAA